MSDGVSVREFARHVGKSHVWILKLIKNGIIQRDDDGLISLSEGMKALEQEKARSEQARAEKRTGAKSSPQPAPESMPKPKHAGQDTLDEFRDKTAKAASINEALNRAKLAEKTYQAKLKEIEYKLRAGELLEKSAVIAEASQLAENIKTQLLAVPPRIASMCEGRPAREIEDIITDAINDALKELQKLKRKGGGDNGSEQPQQP